MVLGFDFRQDEQPDGARQVSASVAVDLGNQPVEREAAASGDRSELGPERLLDRHRRAVARESDRTFADACVAGLDHLRAPPAAAR